MVRLTFSEVKCIEADDITSVWKVPPKEVKQIGDNEYIKISVANSSFKTFVCEGNSNPLCRFKNVWRGCPSLSRFTAYETLLNARNKSQSMDLQQPGLFDEEEPQHQAKKPRQTRQQQSVAKNSVSVIDVRIEVNNTPQIISMLRPLNAGDSLWVLSEHLSIVIDLLFESDINEEKKQSIRDDAREIKGIQKRSKGFLVVKSQTSDQPKQTSYFTGRYKMCPDLDSAILCQKDSEVGGDNEYEQCVAADPMAFAADEAADQASASLNDDDATA